MVYTPDSVAAMLENVVYLELLRRGYEVFIGQLMSGEIDFIATKQGNKLNILIAKKLKVLKRKSVCMDDCFTFGTITPSM